MTQPVQKCGGAIWRLLAASSLCALLSAWPFAWAQAQSVTITPSVLPTPVSGTPYLVELSASGGTAPYVFQLAGGSLPPGLSFTGTQISGTPTVDGSYAFLISATDSEGRDALLYGLGFAPPPGASLVGQSLVPTGMVTPASFTPLSGALPPGMSVSPTGVVSGTPSVAGAYAVSFLVTDADGRSAVVSVSFVVGVLSHGGVHPVPSLSSWALAGLVLAVIGVMGIRRRTPGAGALRPAM